MKCIVTGATGFIGRQLCQQLSARGDVVIGLSRNGASLEDGSATVALDLASVDPDPALLAGADVFFHLAGIAHQHAAPSAYQQLNHLATLRLARAAAAAGVRCFIFLSSVKAMGSPQSSEPRTEADCVYPLDAYGLSKWQAECALREEFGDSPMSVVIVRPALVYGVNAKGNLQRLAAAVRKGLPRPPALGRRSMIAAGDLVSLLCLVADKRPTGVHTWIACGTEPLSTQYIYDVLRAALGKGRGRRWLPLWAWRAATRVLDTVSGAGTGAGDETSFDKLFGTEVYSNEAVVAATGWHPRQGIDTVFAGTADTDGML